MLRAILADLPLTEDCKWGKPCFTRDGNNIVILQGFKDYFALGFFQGALLLLAGRGFLERPRRAE